MEPQSHEFSPLDLNINCAYVSPVSTPLTVYRLVKAVCNASQTTENEVRVIAKRCLPWTHRIEFSARKVQHWQLCLVNQSNSEVCRTTENIL